MPDEDSDSKSSTGLRQPKLHINCAPDYNFGGDSPTSDILLHAVAPRDMNHQHSTVVQTDDGTYILCDSPRPEYSLADEAKHDSFASDRSSNSSHTLHTSDRRSNETGELQPTTTNGSSIPQRESVEEPSTSPKETKGAPPPYADQDRRRNSHDRQEETPRVKPRKVIGNFTLTNTLGAGSMGKVKLAVHNLTNEKVRCSFVRIANTAMTLTDMVGFSGLLKSFREPNIQFIKVIYRTKTAAVKYAPLGKLA
jgi:hypothetical protein